MTEIVSGEEMRVTLALRLVPAPESAVGSARV